MKVNYKYFYLFVIISTLIVSCDPDDPIEPEPEDPRDELVGTWKCSETSNIFGQQNYNVDISKHASDSSKVLIG
jgi:hypothetical protein